MSNLDGWKVTAMEQVIKSVRFWMDAGYSKDDAVARVRKTTALGAVPFAEAVSRA